MPVSKREVQEAKRIPAVASPPASFQQPFSLCLRWGYSWIQGRKRRTSLTEAAAPCLHEGVLARPRLCLKEKGHLKESVLLLFPKCVRRVQARRRVQSAGGRGATGREWDRRACVEVRIKELKAPKTHPLPGRHRWWVCYLWSENGWGLSPSPSPLRHPHETYRQESKEPYRRHYVTESRAYSPRRGKTRPGPS